MSKTLTIRLDDDLAAWLKDLSERTGIPQGKIVRTELERARRGVGSREFLRLAGVVEGPRDLSSRKGFSRS